MWTSGLDKNSSGSGSVNEQFSRDLDLGKMAPSAKKLHSLPTKFCNTNFISILQIILFNNNNNATFRFGVKSLSERLLLPSFYYYYYYYYYYNNYYY